MHPSLSHTRLEDVQALCAGTLFVAMAIIIVVVMFYRGGLVQLADNFTAFIRNLGKKRRLHRYGQDD